MTHSLEPKPYPCIEAIADIFRLAVRCNPEIASFDPLALWNSHYVCELDDSGHIVNSTNKKGGIKNPAFLSTSSGLLLDSIVDSDSAFLHSAEMHHSAETHHAAQLVAPAPQRHSAQK